MNSADSDLVYTPDTARKAAQFFCWHRFLTKHGLLYVGALVVAVAMLVWSYTFMGTDWFFGFWVTILGLNVIVIAASFYGLPKAIAKSVSELKSPHGHIVVDAGGITLSVGGNVTKVPWSRFGHVWVRDDFIVLGNPLLGTCLYIPTEGMTADVKAEFERRKRPAVGA